MNAKLIPIKNKDGHFAVVDPRMATKLSAMYLWMDELGDVLVKNVKHRTYERLLNLDKGARVIAFWVNQDGMLLTLEIPT